MHLQLSRAFVALAFASFARGAIYEDVSQLHGLTYDYVVVGGGTGGLAVASRLSQIPSVKVLVLEAGVSDAGQVVLEAPLLCLEAAPNTQFDWNYTTTAQPGCNNRTVGYQRGYVLGGSSSINYMVYTTGSKDDWDFYAKITGDPGWSYKAMGPYWDAIQHWTPPSSGRNVTGEYLPKTHSERGVVDVSLASYLYPADTRAAAASHQLSEEFPFQVDMNTGNPLGLGWTQYAVGNGSRSSASKAYIYPIINSRPNLDILLHAHATKVLQTATQGGLPVFGAVEFSAKGKTHTVKAQKEVILSAGTFNTPQLLLLSGIGAKAELDAAKIKTIVDLPSVGKNLTDHALIPTFWTTTSNDTWGEHLNSQDIAHWEATHQGPLSNAIDILAWLRLPKNDSVLHQYGDPSNGPTSAHYEILFLENFADPSGTVEAPPANQSILTVGIVLISPTSRGTVSLNNTSPLAAPLINPNYLNTTTDMHILEYGVEAARRLMGAPAWDGYLVGPYGPFAKATTPAALENYIRSYAGTVWHASGTAAMSARGAPYGVVDPDLRVKNTVGLRVVDASVLPRMPTAHTHAIAYSIAERAAVLIAADAGHKLTV